MSARRTRTVALFAMAMIVVVVAAVGRTIARTLTRRRTCCSPLDARAQWVVESTGCDSCKRRGAQRYTAAAMTDIRLNAFINWARSLFIYVSRRLLYCSSYSTQKPVRRLAADRRPVMTYCSCRSTSALHVIKLVPAPTVDFSSRVFRSWHGRGHQRFS